MTVQHHLRVSALSAGHKFKGIIWPLGFNAYSVAVYVNPIACAKELGWRYAPPSKRNEASECDFLLLSETEAHLGRSHTQLSTNRPLDNVTWVCR